MKLLRQLASAITIVSVVFFFTPMVRATTGPVFDNRANSSNSNPISTSYTVGTGSNRILVLFINADGGNITVTSAPTYGGIPMTLSKAVTGNANWGASYSYYMIAPPSGANTLAFTMSSSGYSYSAYSFTNAAQTQVGMASTTINSGAGGQTMTLTLSNNNSIGIGQVSGCSQGGTGLTNNVVSQNGGDQKAGHSNVLAAATGVTFTSTCFEEGTAMEIGEAPATVASFNFWQFFDF